MTISQAIGMMPLPVQEATQLKDFVDPYLYACIYAGLGDADRAFEYLSGRHRNLRLLFLLYWMTPLITHRGATRQKVRMEIRHEDDII